MLEIYIHIPFCRAKCGYCDFNSFYANDDIIENYVKKLCEEIEGSRYKGERADTVFIGGGTPSFIKGKYIEKILTCIDRAFPFDKNCEITVEANPESICSEKLGIYKSSGINRISMGIQSFDDSELKFLGRIHNAETAVSSYYKIREAGFDNVNIDLMFSFPQQTEKSWENSLKTAVSLDPSHISAYSLIIEEGTLFYKKYKNYQTNEDTDRIMYRKTKELLNGFGYDRYEISNFAKPGYECRHNIGYWKRYNYLGFGVSAHSLYNDIRFSNTENFKDYINGDTKGGYEILANDDVIGEHMFLGLRMAEGISLSDFYDRFGIRAEERFGEVIKKYEALGLLEICGGRLRLTDRGIDVSNTIFADFI